MKAETSLQELGLDPKRGNAEDLDEVERVLREAQQFARKLYGDDASCLFWVPRAYYRQILSDAGKDPEISCPGIPDWRGFQVTFMGAVKNRRNKIEVCGYAAE